MPQHCWDPETESRLRSIQVNWCQKVLLKCWVFFSPSNFFSLFLTVIRKSFSMHSLPLLITRKISYPFCNKLGCLQLSYSNAYIIKWKIVPFNPPQKAISNRKNKGIISTEHELAKYLYLLPFLLLNQFFLLDFSKEKRINTTNSVFKANFIFPGIQVFASYV